MNISRIIDIVHNPILDSRLKKDGVTSKTMNLLGIGFLHLVDNIFWNLPFASVKQGISVREKNNISEEDWDHAFQAITASAEHEKDGARQQLIDGWKTWIKDRRARDQGEGGAGTASATFDMDKSVPEEADE